MMTSTDRKIVAVITGASSGIGKATAFLFAKNDFNLSLSGRNEMALKNVVAECIKGYGLKEDQVITTIGNVCEEKTLTAIIDNTSKQFGQIDVLINCAGMILPGGAELTPLSAFNELMEVNVKSVIRLTQLAIPYLAKSKGSIVNVSSVAGICAFPAVTYYSISKAAIDKLTECLALELAPKGIRVNAVNPALIDTGLHKRTYMGEEAYKDFIESGQQTHALGRVGSAEEVAQSILFLARDATFTTGQLLKIDGGKALMTPR